MPVHRVVVIGMVVLTVGLDVSAARADILQDLGATFQRVAQDLAGAFPKAETRIVEVTGDEVRLEGPGTGALRPGLELSAYRKGEPFRHPITNQPLGQSEEEVGILVVTTVTPEHAMARVATTEEGRTAVVGDGARITAGRLAVAVLPPSGVNAPFETADQTALLLVARFSALLEKTGRFLAIEPRRVLEVSGGGGPGPGLTPLEVARRLRVPAVLTSRVIQDGRLHYLETAWISGRTGATIVTGRTPLVRATFPPRFAWEQTPELERRYPLEGPVRGLALADLDGDGRPELVVGDDRAVVVYRWQEGLGLVQVGGGEFRPGGVILSVDAADVNRSGRAQVVVVDHRGDSDGASATVLELAGERLRTLHTTRGRYLRVIPVGSESWLVEQDVGQAEPFEPAIRRLVWQDGRYQRGATLRVPSGVSVYGLALMRLSGKPEPEIVALTPEDRLAVWSARGQRLWTSADPYGGAAITFPFNPATRLREGREGIGRVLGRVIALPDGPEGPEVLVFENVLPALAQARSFFPNLSPGFFTQGRVHRLRWRDGGFVRLWQSTLTEGYVADFGYGDLDGDGAPDVVVGVVPRGVNLDTLNPLARPKGHLVFYELP